MKISIITLFPEVFAPILNSSILKRAQSKGLVEFELVNLRPFGEGVHQVVDDSPYGGGAGLVFKAAALAKALKSVMSNELMSDEKNKKYPLPITHNPSLVILASASGVPYTQKKARELSKLDHIIVICGHYEGVDQRFIDKYVDEEISVGDYVLTGGEIPAMILADSITRLIPGVLKKPEATENESFSNLQPKTSNLLLEHPQYTRPEEFEGLKVPEVLLSGHHGEVDKWRAEQSVQKTQKIRPDLLKK